MELKHFKPAEFTEDLRPVFDKMHPDFLLKLDTCRDLCGVPFAITSSYRSPEKNRRVGGAPGSMHLKGRAVDITCPDGVTRAIIMKTALNLGLSVGVMRNGLHLDDREEQIVFHYYQKYGQSSSEAAKAYDDAAVVYNKDFTNLNFPDRIRQGGG